MANLGLKNSLLVITGAKGVGKTLAASSYLPPSQVEQVFYHDGEHSTNRVVQSLKKRGKQFGYLSNLDTIWSNLGLPGDADLLSRIAKGNLPWANTKEKNSLIAFWNHILEDIDKHLTKDKFRVYVHDPVERLESAMQAWVEENRDKAGWSSKAYGQNWTQGYYPLYRGLMEAIYARGVEVIIFTAHLGSPWAEGGKGVIPGKVKPKAKPDLFRLAQLYVWLVNEPHNADKAPAGIILKERLGDMVPTDNDSWTITPGLPRRVPHFTWDDVQRYMENGFDVNNPAPGESLTEQESQMIDETFYNNEQMHLMLLWAKENLAELASRNPSLINQAGEPNVDVSPESVARELSKAGVTVEQIAEQLNKPIVLVKKWIGGTVSG